jgi:VWFA-related protein
MNYHIIDVKRVKSMLKIISRSCLVLLLPVLLFANSLFAQPQNESNRKKQQKVRTVTIPISIFSREEFRRKAPEEFLEAGEIHVREDGEDQTVLSIRDISESPLALAILIQDDLSSSVNLQLARLGEFIRRLPRGSRVMVAYLRAGSIQVRQKFTEDLEKAAQSLRIIASSSAAAPSSPYQAVEESLRRFDALPTGRRAILLISDGLDASRGLDDTSPGQNIDLDRAITQAQRRGVAVYSIFATATLTQRANPTLVMNAQGSLNRLSDETGGRAFFQGTGTPVSFDPFFRDINLALNRQFVLTYLSSHMKKGYYKISVISSNPDIRIEHPKGYFYR